MRHAWIYGIVAILMLQSLNQVGLVAYYYLNQAYIADVLCINKSRPELKCNGQCYLMQKLRQADEAEHQQPQSAPKSLSKEIFVMCALAQALPELLVAPYFKTAYPPEAAASAAGIKPGPAVPPPRS